jgi:hypothetical protein
MALNALLERMIEDGQRAVALQNYLLTGANT